MGVQNTTCIFLYFLQNIGTYGPCILTDTIDLAEPLLLADAIKYQSLCPYFHFILQTCLHNYHVRFDNLFMSIPSTTSITEHSGSVDRALDLPA